MQDMISCKICGSEMTEITWRHCSSHGITLADYKAMFPDALTMTDQVSAKKRAAAVKRNQNRKGVPRSQETVDKIKQTKRANPRVAWNRGVPRTPEEKAAISATRRDRYTSGEIVHWNTGRTTPDHVRNKIRTTLLSQNRTYSDTSAEKRRNTYTLKKAGGWVKTTSYEITDSHRSKLSLVGNIRREAMTRAAVSRATAIATANGISLACVTSNAYLYSLACNVCNTQYTRTKNAFIESKLDQLAFRCPECFPRSITVSLQELEVRYVIQSLCAERGISVELNNRTLLQDGREIDIYIPELKLGIEYCGLYWHSDNAGGKDRTYHVSKTDMAAQFGIRLITIFEDEWLNKRSIVESKLRHATGCSSGVVIGARKCVIDVIPPMEKNTFLNMHHLQGGDVCRYSYGAFVNQELVAVMTFSVSNMSKGGDGSTYELSRFAVKTGMHVPGIASRMLKRFLVDHQPDEIITYADRRWSAGNVYDRIGFKPAGITPPSYWYISRENGTVTRKHRSQFMKHMLSSKLDTYDETLTEWENMKANGYDRIWDCGNYKFVLTRHQYFQGNAQTSL